MLCKRELVLADFAGYPRCVAQYAHSPDAVDKLSVASETVLGRKCPRNWKKA